jgi:hypothetical protein
MCEMQQAREKAFWERNPTAVAAAAAGSGGDVRQV